MSPAVEIPLQLLLVLLAALTGSQAGVSALDEPLAQSASQQAVTVSPDPYRFAPQAFFDALAGLRQDPRFQRYSRRVFKTSSGVAYVPNASEAQAILALRHDATIARHVAEHYARANARALSAALGRDVGVAELYLAHRVGLRLAIDLLRLEQKSPQAKVALALPELDEVAPELVFRGERAMTISDIRALVENTVARARANAGPGLQAPRTPGRRAARSAKSTRVNPDEREAQILGWHTEIARGDGAR